MPEPQEVRLLLSLQERGGVLRALDVLGQAKEQLSLWEHERETAVASGLIRPAASDPTTVELEGRVAEARTGLAEVQQLSEQLEGAGLIEQLPGARWRMTASGQQLIDAHRWRCFLCGKYFSENAYAFDGLVGRREYLCTTDFRSLRDRQAHELTLAGVPVEAKQYLLGTLHRLVAAAPQPCEVCGRKFAWVGGYGVRRVTDTGLLALGMQRPRPRRHICSDICRREHRNRPRRVQPDQRACAACGHAFKPKRADAQFCSGRCRMRAHRARR